VTANCRSSFTATSDRPRTEFIQAVLDLPDNRRLALLKMFTTPWLREMQDELLNTFARDNWDVLATCLD